MAKEKSIETFIHPLHMNGMTGRALYYPSESQKDTEIFVIYGHHSSLERWWGLVQNFAEFGSVYMPDLPGFGGMESFYKIHRKPDLDAYADYIAALVEMRHRRKKLIIVGISFGFLVATRMLQRYPELATKVAFLVSAVGFLRSDNFLFSPLRYRTYRYGARILSIRPLPFIFRHTALSAPVLRATYARTHNARHKFKHASNAEEFDAMMQMEIDLWQHNDARTYFKTAAELLTVDNCGIQVNVPVYHVYTPNDNYFDNAIIEQQMQVVFSEYAQFEMKSISHAPSVIATKAEAAQLIPAGLRKVLKSETKLVRTRSKKGSNRKK